MALTTNSLAGAMRLSLPLADPQHDVLQRLLQVANEVIENRAPMAPEPVRDEAKIRLCAYLYDSPGAAGSDRFAAAFRNSGARGLLEPWVVHRAGGADG